jgi:hypothetical protein
MLLQIYTQRKGPQGYVGCRASLDVEVRKIHDPAGSRTLSRDSTVNIVMGCGAG